MGTVFGMITYPHHSIQAPNIPRVGQTVEKAAEEIRKTGQEVSVGIVQSIANVREGLLRGTANVEQGLAQGTANVKDGYVQGNEKLQEASLNFAAETVPRVISHPIA